MADVPADKTIAIDFDGVIHDYRHPVHGKRMGKPFAGAEEAIDDLIQRGYKIVVHTVKAQTAEGRQAVVDWLDYYTIDHHEVTAQKPNALVYIDDRAIRHETWPDTINKLNLITGYTEDL